jgi:Fe-S cluster assembly ATP-binding protein
MAMLEIRDLRATVAEKAVLKGLNLSLPKGEVHIIMGPNGVGKSTLSHVLMGNSNFKVQGGSVQLDGVEMLGLDTSERAKKGLFLAFQYPVSIPGLRISEYLRNLYNLHHGGQVGVSEFRKLLRSRMEMLSLGRDVASRYLNEGFSGGEMKRLEMLQLSLMQPKVAILDEIDSGVDIDAQKIIADAISEIARTTGTAFLIITHYQRMLRFLSPHKIHVLMDGAIARSGDISIVDSLEREGYDWVRKQVGEGNEAN